MGLLHDVENGALVEVGLGEDQLVGPHGGENPGQVGERLAEERQTGLAGRRDRSDQVVADPAARGGELPLQPTQALSRPDQHDAPANPHRLQQLQGSGLVGRAQNADRDRARHDRGRDQAGRAEYVVRTEAECQDDQCDEDKGRDDPPPTRPPLARRVEARPQEDEHGHRSQERKPLGCAGPPEQRPVDRVAVQDRPDHEGRHQTERETGDVEDDECQDADGPARSVDDHAAREIPPRRSDVSRLCRGRHRTHLRPSVRRSDVVGHARILPRRPDPTSSRMTASAQDSTE